MREMGVSNAMIRFVCSYHSGRTFAVKLGGHMSTSRSIVAKVLQGSCLEFNFFLIFMSNFLRFLAVDISLYTEDAAMYTSCRNDDIMCRGL